MERLFKDAEDEPFEELLFHSQVYGNVCAKTDPPCGPFLAPRAVFIDDRRVLEPWVPTYDEHATFEDLIESIRVEANARSSAGLIEGAALMLPLKDLQGRVGMGVQIHTRMSSTTFVFPLADDGVSLAEPEEAELLVPDGLCRFVAQQ